jgi:hypothetical protein
LIKYLDGGDLENFMYALFGSAGDLIQGDSGVSCDLGVSSHHYRIQRLSRGRERLN